ncbi:phosphotriesterase family protein [Agromyces binzhouensis]|uniref:phosphotriesterase family protein n=1 Tax=Agromyces binzhouensis TaxID=1817495 RepID=UPI00362ED01F
MADVMTVRGPVPPSELGRVMPHEHLLSLTPGPWLTTGTRDDRIALAVGALAGLEARGFGTVVDLSPYGVVGRDPDGAEIAMLAEISERTGLHIVSGTALYLEAYAPAWAREATLDELTARFVADAVDGIGGSGIRAGIFGEQATSLGEITPFEDRVLRAVARAHRETGLAIMTHTTHGTMAHEQVDLLASEGVDLDRVVIGHLDTQLSVDLARSILDRGALIAVDTIGKEVWDFFLEPAADRPDGEFPKRSFARSDRGRVEFVAELVADGYADRIVLAQDLTGAEVWMNPGTHGQLGYAHLADRFLPALAAHGVPEDAIERMTARTPARLLEVGA